MGEVLRIERLTRDPLVEKLGAPVDAPYCELFWLPVIGPTSLWLVRHVVRHTADGDYRTTVEQLAPQLGVSNRSIVRALHRLERFTPTRWDGSTRWWMPTHLPPLSLVHRRRLPEPLRERHDALMEAR